VIYREEDGLELWRNVLGEQNRTSKDGRENLRLSKLTISAEILDRIAAVNAGLRRADQALQAVHDAESLRTAARTASSAPSKRYVNGDLTVLVAMLCEKFVE
jgi:hypothetical protein